MVTAFAKAGSSVGVTSRPQESKTWSTSSRFARLSSGEIYHNKTTTLIPVPAIRPSFPEQTFRYRAD